MKSKRHAYEKSTWVQMVIAMSILALIYTQQCSKESGMLGSQNASSDDVTIPNGVSSVPSHIRQKIGHVLWRLDHSMHSAGSLRLTYRQTSSVKLKGSRSAGPLCAADKFLAAGFTGTSSCGC